MLFASFGGKWTALAGAAIVTAGIMSAAMLFDSRKEGEGIRKVYRTVEARALSLQGLGRRGQLRAADTGR